MSAPMWAADGPELDTLTCWVDVPEYATGTLRPCGNDPAPDSTLCAWHRRQLTEQQAEATR
jgi:hypothetical protein